MPNPKSPSRASPRRGFTVLELLLVITIVGVLVGLAFPKLAPIRDQAGVRTAREIITTNIAIARQSAIRRGTDVSFNISGDTTWVSAGGTNLEPRRDLASLHGVTVSTALTTITYNARGLARVTATPRKITISRGASTDSVCVSLLGGLGRCGF